MLKNTKKNVASILKNFQKLMANKPTVSEMVEDIRMMKFKIRPLQGDISLLSKSNDYLIEMLWSLGKLDEMFQREYRRLNENNRQLFYKIFEKLRAEYQEELNKVTVKQDWLQKKDSLEMEIFRDLPLKRLN